MSSEEPETKHLCVSELRAYLAQAKGGHADSITATRVGQTMEAVGKPKRGKAAEQRAEGELVEDVRATRDLKGVQPMASTQTRLRVGCSDDALTLIYKRSDLLPEHRRSRWNRRLLQRLALSGFLACGGTLWLALKMHRGPGEPRATSGAVTDHAPAPTYVAPKQESVVPTQGATGPAQGPIASEGDAAQALKPPKAEVSGVALRGAVDLLLAGETRAALDAYRNLHARASDVPELALAVRLLERELERCKKGDGGGGSGACAR